MSSIDGLGGGGFGGKPLMRGTPLVGAPEQDPRGPRVIGELDELQTEGADSPSGNLFSDLINAASERKGEVVDKVEALAAGEPVDLHEVMISMGKSEVTFNLMLEVRNKLIDAWRELQRSVV